MKSSRSKFQQTREVVLYALKYVKGDALDLGAGTAKYRDIIKAKATSYVTYDLMPGPHIDVVGDLLHTGFESDKFDTIFSTQVFEHIPKPWHAARELYRITKPRGVCVVTAPFLQPYHADPHDYYRYTVEGIRALFEDAGFEVLECDAYTKLFTVMIEAIHHTLFSPYEKKRTGSDIIMKVLSKAARILDGWIRCGKIYGNVYLIARKKE